MIKITKKDVLISYVGYFLKLFSNILVLPYVLIKLSSDEYGLWAVFLSLGSITILLDMGFGSVIVRYTTYAFCGATELPKRGLPNVTEEGDPNYKLLFLVILSAKKIYRNIGLIALSILVIGSLYILHIANGNLEKSEVLIAWLLYASGVVLSLYFMYYSSVYKGLGKIKDLQIMVIINQTIYVILQIVLLYLGFGIIALASSNLIVAILLRIQLSSRIKKIIKQNQDSYISAKSDFNNNYKTIYNSLVFNSKGLGYVLISTYIQNQGNIMLCSVFLSLKEVGSYSLTMQIIGVISAMSAVTFNTYLPRMNSLQLASKMEDLKNTYSMVTVLSYILFFIGGIILLMLGRVAVSLIGSKTTMLPMLQTSLLLLYIFIMTNHQRSTNFISLGNKQPYVKAYIISSMTSLLLSIILMYFGAGLLGLIISNLVIQSIYNGWKWPYEAFKINKLTPTETFSRGLNIVFKRTTGLLLKLKS
jgi:O-antigen/teichoic acid export membrane protein